MINGEPAAVHHSVRRASAGVIAYSLLRAGAEASSVAVVTTAGGIGAICAVDTPGAFIARVRAVAVREPAAAGRAKSIRARAAKPLFLSPRVRSMANSLKWV